MAAYPCTPSPIRNPFHLRLPSLPGHSLGTTLRGTFRVLFDRRPRAENRQIEVAHEACLINPLTSWPPRATRVPRKPTPTQTNRIADVDHLGATA